MALTLKSAWASRTIGAFVVDGGVLMEKKNGWTEGAGFTVAGGSLTFNQRTWNGNPNTEYWIMAGQRIDITSPPTLTATASVIYVFSQTGSFVSASLSGNATTALRVEGAGDGRIVTRNGGDRVAVSTTTITSTSAWGFRSASLAAGGGANSPTSVTLEGGTASDELDASPTTQLAANPWVSIGGISGIGTFNCQPILAMATNDLVSLSEWQSIISNPIGTLFDSSGGGPIFMGQACLTPRRRYFI